MKVLLLDIESAPNTAYVWGLWKENIPIDRLIESSFMLCWAAKWLDSDEIMFGDYLSGNEHMLSQIHQLLDEAEGVVHFNGSRFDIPVLNKEFLVHGFNPPSPYIETDLYRVAKNRFRFPSNKLDYIAQRLGVGKKVKHAGMGLWIRCMEGDVEAMRDMQKYNEQDVRILEGVYKKMLPWIHRHANMSLDQRGVACPRCGSYKVHKRGTAYTGAMAYQRMQCQDCGGWFRTGGNVGPKPDEKGIAIK